MKYEAFSNSRDAGTTRRSKDTLVKLMEELDVTYTTTRLYMASYQRFLLDVGINNYRECRGI